LKSVALVEDHASGMNVLCILLLVALLPQAPATQNPTDEPRFESGKTWQQFLASVSAQRELWHKTESVVTVPRDLIDRAERASDNLQLLVVAEDWCPDSVFTLPYVARLAESARIPLRIFDRASGESLMRAHTTRDGRTATPTIVLRRNGRDAGAWVERPAELQEMFFSMSTNAENARRFAQRQTWYELDGGRTVLKEVLALIEQTRAKE
jgi:hypothetical protein